MMEGGRREEEEEEEEEGGLVELLLSSPSSSTAYSSSMFCFIGEGQEVAAQRSSTDSSLSSSPSNSTMTTCFKASVKEEEINGGMSWSDHGSNKRAKRDGPGSKGMIKVRKERLGERIAALQQLVSPFGKSDTASVLHEALAYIRFLHDQLQVLSSPYMQRLPSSASLQGKKEEAGLRKLGDLESRGLCLVPLSCTFHVANTNGADLWAHSHSNLGPTSTSTSPLKPSSF